MRIVFAHNRRQSDSEAEAEFDSPETIEAITGWLEELGHEVVPLDVGGSAALLVARLEALAPDLVFNTAEGRRGRAREAFYPALFEQLGLPYTASDAYVCALTLDKHLTKRVVAEAGVSVPRGLLVTDVGRLKLPEGFSFPAFIKPNFEGSSKGITAKSLVQDGAELVVRVAGLLERYPDGVLVEEYIPGTDVAVAFLESGPREAGGVLPPVVYHYASSAHGEAAIYDYDLKNTDSDSVSVEVGGLSPRVLEALQSSAAEAYRALGIRDVGRIDFRVTDDGDIFFLEVNALPSLEPGAGIYEAAKAIGLSHEREVLRAIVDSAAHRHGKAHHAHSRRRRARVGLTFNLKRSASEDDAEFDSMDTVEAMADAIRSEGHDVVLLEATSELPSTVAAANVDVVFNIAEGIRGASREAQVPALLDLLGTPYTGSEPATLSTTLDKSLAKRLVRDAGLLTPEFQVFTSSKTRLDPRLSFPLVVKPLREGSSKGIEGSPVVHDERALRARLALLLERFEQPVLVEAFLSGREFTVGLLGAKRPRVLEPMEVVFNASAGSHPVYGLEAKKDGQDQVSFVCPAELNDERKHELRRFATDVWAALGCRDVARVDIRLDAFGRPHFIECNPLPGLAPGFSDLVIIAERSGMSYRELIAAILAPALLRWRRLRPTKVSPAVEQLSSGHVRAV